MIKTVCPGCGLGCGLYFEEKEMKVWHRKVSSVNEGKLCRFGMNLPSFYRERAIPRIDGKEVSLDDAIKEACRRTEGKKIAFLCSGNATMEEMIAFKELASSFGTSPSTHFHAIRPEATLKDIEESKKILLLVDPWIQYPLLGRRILSAKKNGATIISTGIVPSRMGDELISLPPDDPLSMRERFEEVDLDLVIADPQEIPVSILGFCRARIFSAQPLINSAGCAIFDFSPFPEDADGFYLLEPDARILKKLPPGKLTIIHSSREHEADVLLPNDPFFMRKGTIINSEGRILLNDGKEEGCIPVIKKILQNLGMEELSYQICREKLMELLKIQEDRIIAAGERKIPESGKMKMKTDSDFFLYQIPNPFMWHGIVEKKWVGLNIEMIRELSLERGDEIEIVHAGRKVKREVKVMDLPRKIILSHEEIFPGDLLPVEVG